MEGIDFYLNSCSKDSVKLPSRSFASSLSESLPESIILLPEKISESLQTARLNSLPSSYSELRENAQKNFQQYEILAISFKDPEDDLIAIRNDSDLQAAYRTGYGINNILQIYLKGSVKIQAKFSESIVFQDANTTDNPPDFIKECYFVPCYKCMSNSQKCIKCNGIGLLDAYSDPKLNSARAIIRTEMQNYLPKLLSAISGDHSSIIHSNVSCNNCGIYPIIGNRFKCSVCNNFDFCQRCEKNTFHEHSFIKITNPEQAPKVIFCTFDDPKKKNCKPKNRQCEPQTRLLCRFVRDVVGNEGDCHGSGEVFLKSWRLRNDGMTQWPRGCKLIFTNGDFRGDDVCLPCLKPGEERDVSVTCRSPDKDGRYNSYWRAIDPEGNRFGQRFSIMIIVKHQLENNDDLNALREIFNNPELVKLAYAKAGGSTQKAAELLLSGNIL